MSILLIGALLVAQASGGPGVAAEAVVITGKLKKWTARYEVRGASSVCRTKTSSGDGEVDAIGCAAFNRCLAPLQSRIDASDAKAVPNRERKAMKSAIKADLSSCTTRTRDQLVAELAERRFEARQGMSQ